MHVCFCLELRKEDSDGSYSVTTTGLDPARLGTVPFGDDYLVPQSCSERTVIHNSRACMSVTFLTLKCLSLSFDIVQYGQNAK